MSLLEDKCPLKHEFREVTFNHVRSKDSVLYASRNSLCILLRCPTPSQDEL
jgi:hypothetical protein